jgi:guanylate kinase
MGAKGKPMTTDSLLIVVSGPGGVGKSTVVKALVDRYPELWLSRSWTTRQRRPTEDPEAYVFVSREEFESRIEADGFLEYAEFLGNYYGTPVFVPPDGRDVILEIDVQGARQVLRREPEAVLIFLQAPSQEEQLARLRRRGDPEEKVAQRVQKATQEADAGRELNAQIVTNFDINETVEIMWSIIEKARAAQGRTGL